MRRSVLAMCLVAAPGLGLAADFYNIDPAHTFPHFAASHLGFSTLYGRFDMTVGKVMIDRENNTGFIDVKIAAVSINTGHIKRDDHLRSTDFFNVMEFPNITYKSTKIRYEGTEEATVEGNLTILGVEKAVLLKVTHMRCGTNPITSKPTCGFGATANIKRSEFGMKFGSPGIGDDVKMWFEVEAVKES